MKWKRFLAIVLAGAEKSELLEALQMYFRVFFLNEDMDLAGKE